MRMKFFKIIALGVLVMSLWSCSSISDIRINTVDVTSVTPKSVRSIDAVISLEIDNPAGTFTMSDIIATIYNEDKALASIKTDDLTIDKKSLKTYDLKGTLTLNEEISIMNLMSLARNMNKENLTLDFSANAKMKNGIRKALKYENVKISELIDL